MGRQSPRSSISHALLLFLWLSASYTTVQSFPNLLAQVSDLIQRGPPWGSPPVNLIIDEIGLRDTGNLADFMLSCEGYDQETVNRAKPDLEERLRACVLDGVTLTAATDADTGALVGMYACTNINHLDLPPPPPMFPRTSHIVPRILLSDLKILPAWRKKGVATQLLRYLEEDVSSSGAVISLFVAKDNLPARRLYAKMAYIPAHQRLPEPLLQLANISPFEVYHLDYLMKYVKRKSQGIKFWD